MLTCSTCGESLPDAEVNTRTTRRRGRVYLSFQCKACVRLANASTIRVKAAVLESAKANGHTITCIKCHLSLPYSVFVKGQTQLICKQCRWERRNARVFEVRASMLRNRSANRGALCDIDGEHLRELWEVQKGLCAYSGIPMRLIPLERKSKHRIGDPDAWSVDRIDCAGGYVKGNVVLCCNAINIFKGAGSVADMVRFSRAVADRGEALLLKHG